MNQLLLDTLPPDNVDVMIQRAEEAEVDEMWSYVGKKQAPRWLWHAIDHRSGQSLRTSWGAAKMRSFYSSKPCWNRLASRGIIRITGALIRVISMCMSTNRASATRSKLSGSTCRGAPGSNAWCARRSAFPDQPKCMTSSLGCLAIAMSLGCRCETVKCKSVT